MSLFELAIPITLRREGGLVENILDAGGITNFGISLRWLLTKDPTATSDTIRNMTQDQAKALYQKYWWIDAYSAIAAQMVATKIFDTAVNAGPGHAHKFAQTIVGVVPDGILGPKSVAEINAYPSAKFLVSYQNLMAQHYRNIVAANPKDAPFLKGWLNRAYDRV